MSNHARSTRRRRSRGRVLDCGCHEHDVFASLMGERCSACIAGIEHCDEILIDHADGSTWCTVCGPDPELLHVIGASCSLMEPPCGCGDGL